MGHATAYHSEVQILCGDIRKQAVGLGGENDRNLLMYESAAPLARLYKGIVSLDHTFVLQEYFIPHDNFAKWMKNIRVLLKKPFEHVTLLNITIRYLYKDDNSFLPYATNNMFAFVFYYRLKRTTTADQDLEHIHNRFVEIALSLGGTFYLPYRHHYSDEQLRQAYPRIETFFKRKAHYDPKNVFSNLWYKRYARTVVDVHQRPSSLNKQKLFLRRTLIRLSFPLSASTATVRIKKFSSPRC